jgi:copper transport protein
MLGLLGVVAGRAAPASAHAALVGSSPAADSVVQVPPTQVVLTFTEVVNPVAGKVRVIAPDGTRVDRDDARSSGLQLIIPLKPVDDIGTYLVTFRVVSADSHPIGGAFSFSY